jgi:hypothetical protein
MSASGVLLIGLSDDEREVVVNLPYMPDNGSGWTHVTFSPEQARTFARKVLKLADQCADPERIFDVQAVPR